MSGADLPVVKDDGPMPDHAIVIGGNNRQLAAVGVKLDSKALGEEGFVLKTAGEHPVLAGTGKRGTLYATTTFLEKLGVRWLTPTITRVPASKNIAVPALDETQTPAFEYREPFFAEALDKGDIDAGIWSAGQTQGLIHDIPSCAELVSRIMKEAEAIIRGRLDKALA